MRSSILVSSALLILLQSQAGVARAQAGNASWKRTETEAPPKTLIFHATGVANLPTTATYQKGFFQFEISHRFVNPLSSGYKTFYGMDGPANIRLGLGYAITDHMNLTLGRTNVRGNVDLVWKWRLLEMDGKTLPTHLALILGGAWDTNSPLYPSSSSRAWQYFAQLIVNTLVTQRFVLGVVPSYLGNSIPESDDTEHALTLGLYGQYYLTSIMSLFLEWNVIDPGYHFQHDPMAWGIELETGGHFFKLVFTNAVRINASQVLPGSIYNQHPREWRFGFNIIRLLHF